ncbi:MAG TPA: RagB/SusD family nutrient uptake outer membrane protein [Gemmatimonadales bacterium]|nr:RagB/SusD family nutrient uptake outer membrane protein [Gemmatimonadales bacterium]
MNTKAWKGLTVAGVLCLAVGSCTDLTELPQSTTTEANVFSDPSSYVSFLAKIYGGLALSGQQGPAGQPDISGIDEGFSQYLRLYWETEELPTEEAVIAWNDIGLPEMNTQLWTAQSNMVVAMYYRIFFQVALANEFLRQTTDDQLTARGNVSSALRDQIHTYRAEARFLRALSYWHGIDLFGAIPLVTENDPVGSTPPKQSTRVDIYNYIVSELTAIRTLLPAPGASTYGRATGPAADMLLAELYLNAGVYTGTPDYSDALTSAQAVINSGAYSLDTKYQNLFLADNNKSPEIIFAITQDGLKTQTYGGVTFLAHASCGGSMSNSTYGIDGCWWGLRVKLQALNNYAAGDKRDAFFYSSGQTDTVFAIPTFQNGIAAPKFQNVTSTGAPGSNGTFVDTDFPMFRLGEAYLIYAEAQLRGGGGSRPTALNYVNALRVRAYGDSTGVIADSLLTLPFILDERGRELLWEGHRRTDLIRYGLFTGGSRLWEWKGGTLAGTATQSFRDLYPLPASECIANPNLTQNPGYGSCR